MSEVHVTKPKIRCSQCNAWFEPEWKFHKAHKAGWNGCPGMVLVQGSLQIQEDHLITYCKCGVIKAQPVLPEDEG